MAFLLKLVPAEPQFAFLKYRMAGLIFSACLVLISLGGLFILGLNTGIDFRGGFLIEMRAKNGQADIPQLRGTLEALNLGDVSIQEFGLASDVLIRVQSQNLAAGTAISDLSDDDKAAAARVTDAVGDAYETRRVEYVGAVVGGELRQAALIAVLAALAAIMLYIWFRFEWPFAASAVVALAHDVITTIGLFAITGLEFNLATVAALLTIAGYSINDTVVVFDRVRDNLRKYKSWDNFAVLNLSLNETLSRTVMTSVTTLLALAAIYFFGGAVLADFALAMIWGVFIGTYSSIFVAVSVLYFFNLKPDGDDDANAAAIAKPEYEK